MSISTTKVRSGVPSPSTSVKDVEDVLGSIYSFALLVSRLHSTKKLRSMLEKGMTPYIQIDSENLTAKEASDLEILLISRFGRKDLGLGPLLNCTDGGDGGSGRIKSIEELASMRRKLTGRKFSLSHRNNLKLTWHTNKRQDFIDSTKRSVLRISPNGTVKRYESVTDIRRIDHFSPLCVRQVLKGERKEAYGFEWRYENS